MIMALIQAIRPDGKVLLILNYFKPIGWTAQRNAEIKLFNLGSNFELVSSDGQVQNPIKHTHALPVLKGSLPFSADFGKDGKYILFTQKAVNSVLAGNASETLYYRNFYTASQFGLQGSVMGDVRRGIDNRLYVAQRNTPNVLGFNETNTGTPVAETTKDFSLSTTGTGHVTTQIHKIYPDRNPFEGIYARAVGNKDYELKDHLGNVTVVVTDVKLATLSGLNVRNTAMTKAYSNYYPFGLTMPRRSFPSNDVANSGYRYGFNGKEKDDSGEFGGNAVYDYGFRIYNPSIGRFLSRDPLSREYPELSPYQFAGNNPIWAIDLDGAEPLRKIDEKPKAEPQLKLGDIDKVLENGRRVEHAIHYTINSLDLPGVNLKDPEVYNRVYRTVQSNTIIIPTNETTYVLPKNEQTLEFSLSLQQFGPEVLDKTNTALEGFNQYKPGKINSKVLKGVDVANKVVNPIEILKVNPVIEVLSLVLEPTPMGTIDSQADVAEVRAKQALNNLFYPPSKQESFDVNDLKQQQTVKSDATDLKKREGTKATTIQK